jgi:hypothetical protein
MTAKKPRGLEYVKRVAHKMLERLEKELDRQPSKEQGEDALVAKHHERLFGVKASLAETLVEVAWLVMKLEEVCVTEYVKQAGVALSEADAALLEAFVHKVRVTDAG